MYMAWATALVSITWCVYWYLFFYWIPSRHHSVVSEGVRHRGFAILTYVMFGSVGLFYWFLWVDVGNFGNVPATPSDWSLVLLGGAALILGQSLMLMARRSLSFLSNTAVLFRLSDTLVNIGPYRWTAHPMYVGFLLALGGSALMYLNPVAVAGLLWFVAVMEIRSRIERPAP